MSPQPLGFGSPPHRPTALPQHPLCADGGAAASPRAEGGQGGGRTGLTARGRRPPGEHLRERRRTPRCRCRRPWWNRAAPRWAEPPAALSCGAAATSGQDGTGRRGPRNSRESSDGTAPCRAEVREESGSEGGVRKPRDGGRPLEELLCAAPCTNTMEACLARLWKSALQGYVRPAPTWPSCWHPSGLTSIDDTIGETYLCVVVPELPCHAGSGGGRQSLSRSSRLQSTVSHWCSFNVRCAAAKAAIPVTVRRCANGG